MYLQYCHGLLMNLLADLKQSKPDLGRRSDLSFWRQRFQVPGFTVIRGDEGLQRDVAERLMLSPDDKELGLDPASIILDLDRDSRIGKLKHKLVNAVS